MGRPWRSSSGRSGRSTLIRRSAGKALTPCGPSARVLAEMRPISSFLRRAALAASLILALAAGAAAGESGAADERVRWLAEHAVAVRSIAPADADVADLKPLVQWIGNARVV